MKRELFKEEAFSLSDLSECDYAGKRILLVEDNDLNREIAKEIIGMTGAEIGAGGKDNPDRCHDGKCTGEGCDAGKKFRDE